MCKDKHSFDIWINKHPEVPIFTQLSPKIMQIVTRELFWFCRKAINIIRAVLQWQYWLLTKEIRHALDYALHKNTVLPQMLSQNWQNISILSQSKHKQENNHLI